MGSEMCIRDSKEMYRHFKTKIMYSQSHFEHNFNDKSQDSSEFSISDLISSKNLIRLSLLKLVLVQILTFLWKILTLNFLNSDYILLVLEGFILDYHIVEAILHYSVVIMIFGMVFLLRRFVLKKRYIYN